VWLPGADLQGPETRWGEVGSEARTLCHQKPDIGNEVGGTIGPLRRGECAGNCGRCGRAGASFCSSDVETGEDLKK